MKRVFLLIVLGFVCFISNSQVGIGTTNPDGSSILDITSLDKGVLVPRVSLNNVTNSITPINSPATGLLVWNTNSSVTGGNGVGFYFFNGSQWMPIIQTIDDDHDFYEEGTISAPDNIADDMFTQGNVAIGKNTADYRLELSENSSLRTLNISNSSATSGVLSSIFNQVSGNTGSATDSQRGIYNFLTGNGSGIQYGTYNNIGGSGDRQKYGTYNTIGGSANANNYGTYNTITSTSTTNVGRFGNYNLINNSGSSTNHGTYNIIQGSASGQQFGTFNWILNSSTSNKYGVRNLLSGQGNQYGVFNSHSGTSTGFQTGVYNDMNITNNANTATQTAIYNYLHGSDNGIHNGTYNLLTGNGSGDKYGTYTLIQNTAGGTHYGLYSSVLKTGSFAGYFLGSVSIGTTAANNYIFPASRGTANQIMQTDGAGNVNWVDATTVGDDDHDFYEIGSTNAPNDINDNQYTLGNLHIGASSFPVSDLTITSTNSYAQTINQSAENNDGIDINITNNVTSSSSGVNMDITTTGTGNVFGQYIAMRGSSSGSTTGLRNWYVGSSSYSGSVRGVANDFYSSTGTTQKGVENLFSNNSSTTKFGLNNLFGNSGSSVINGTTYGVYNDYSFAGSGASGNKYGVYNDIPATVGGTHYGIYSDVTKSNSYSGYFLGRVSIGTTTGNNYILPASRGTDTQIMETDGTGNVSWVDKNDNSALSLIRVNVDMDYIQAATGAGWTAIQFDTEVFDTNNEFNTGTYTFTAATAGYYRVNASYHTTAQANTNYYGIAVFVNGSVYAESTHNHHNVGDVVRQVDCMVSLAASDTVQIRIRPESNAVTIDSFTGKTFMEIQQIKRN